MKFQYSLNATDLKEICSAHRKTYKWTSYRYIVAVILFVFAILSFLGVSDKSAFPPLLLLGVYFLFANKMYEARLAKQLAPVIQGEFNIEITDELLKNESGMSKSETPLSTIKAISESENILFLYQSRVMFFPILKSSFGSESELEKFKSTFNDTHPSKL